ncbi:hypothetical protein JXA32_12175 [Candidatus Sumerlaeota bacterium]|nr:hypothetical protein [Candidatus Sumerlaeota bacterium]
MNPNQSANGRIGRRTLSVLFIAIGMAVLPAAMFTGALSGTSYAEDKNARPDEAKNAAPAEASEAPMDYAQRIGQAETGKEDSILREWIRDLRDREQQIQKREKQLEHKRQELLTLEQDIERQAQQIKTLRERLDQEILKVDKVRQKKIDQLVVVLNDKKTDARKAAEIFQQIDIGLAASILLQLDSKKAGEIVSALDADVTAKMIAEMNRIHKPDAQNLP